MRNSGITIIEVMIAVALASSLCAIGFTGITAFSRSITRAKQFVSETELTTAAIRASIASADALSSPSSQISTSTFSSPMLVPSKWVTCSFTPIGTSTTGYTQLTFALQISNTNTNGLKVTASTTGDVANALKMNASRNNTLNIQSLPCQ
jgi:type II secretory pathway pseudopilin PulG